jgi:SAM-dependent methyltransferase
VPELVWKGKSGASGVALRPHHRLRTDEIHGELAELPGDSFADDTPSPRGRLVHGDAEDVLPALLPELRGRVALVYLDPPFDTGGSFDYLVRVPGSADDAPRVAVPAYRDARGLDAWLSWFHGIAQHLRDLLAPGGSLYVHLDAHAAHYAKVLLDEVFGADAFQREIVWRIGWVSGFKSRARAWVRNHDTILFYAKGGRPSTFHKEYVPYPAGYARRDGTPPKGQGYPIDDVWNGSEIDRLDSIQIVSFSGEKVGYPTQKNEALLSRIVRASSNPGDVVLDCCAGSGTTAVVASKLGRCWVACDASPVAVHAARKRLLSSPETPSFLVQSARPETSPAAREGKVGVRASWDGARATIELTSFQPARRRGQVDHWSQWIDAWCVDWEHADGALRASTYVRRSRAGELLLEAAHDYDGAVPREARVKIFDVLGGTAVRAVAWEKERGAKDAPRRRRPPDP